MPTSAGDGGYDSRPSWMTFQVQTALGGWKQNFLWWCEQRAKQLSVQYERDIRHHMYQGNDIDNDESWGLAHKTKIVLSATKPYTHTWPLANICFATAELSINSWTNTVTNTNLPAISQQLLIKNIVFLPTLLRLSQLQPLLLWCEACGVVPIVSACGVGLSFWVIYY